MLRKYILPHRKHAYPLITGEKNSLFVNGYRLPWGQWYITKLHHQYIQDICIAAPNFWPGSCGIEGKTDTKPGIVPSDYSEGNSSLPKRTAKCAVYLLAGTLPLEGRLDIQIASLLHMAGGQRNTILFVIGMYQLSTQNTKSTSWFIYAARRLAHYNLDATMILERTGLLSFKTIITNYWTNHLREEIATKSSLRYLRPESCDLKKPHASGHQVATPQKPGKPSRRQGY